LDERDLQREGVLKQDKRPFEIYDEIWMLSHIRYESEVHPKRISDLVIDYNDESKPVLHEN